VLSFEVSTDEERAVPATLTFPSVYIQEAESAVRAIVGVATSIAAFVGRAQRGPIDLPVVISSYADFERTFGGLWTGSELGFAVRSFYLNGGSQAVIVRLFSEHGSAKSAAEAVAAAVAAESAANGATVQSVAKAGADAVAAAGAPGATAAAAAKAVADAGSNAAAQAGAKVKDVVDAAIAAVAPAIAAVGAAPGAGAAQIKVDTLTLQAASPGAWGSQLRVRVDTKVDPSLVGQAFNLSLRDGSTGQIEVFLNVTVTDGARRVDNVLRSQSRLVVAVGALAKAPPKAHGDPQPGQDIWKLDALSTVAQTAGDDGGELSANDFTGPSKEASKTGLYALRNADLFNLLVIPPHLAGGDIDASLVTPALALCAERRALFLLDGRSDWSSKQAAIEGIGAFQGDENNKNAALFFPRLVQPNPLHENQLEPFAAAGAVAGVFARTDASRGVWKAPAGLDASLNGVPALSVALTDGEVGELNPLGVNCLRTTPASGRVVWGSRTLDGADRLTSQWKYIPVRRTALFIEESLYRATQWLVFEPNDELLWSQIRLNIGAFLHDLFRKGAFQGTTPKDAYFVKCDKDTTTQSDIDLGIVNIIVGFAPLKPAEFVVITLQQIAGQIDV
jgi:phage tail sheath protein FI